MNTDSAKLVSELRARAKRIGEEGMEDANYWDMESQRLLTEAANLIERHKIERDRPEGDGNRVMPLYRYLKGQDEVDDFFSQSDIDIAKESGRKISMPAWHLGLILLALRDASNITTISTESEKLMNEYFAILHGKEE